MTDSLDTLRPEVREAIRDLAIAARLRPEYQQPVGIIRAELLLLAQELHDTPPIEIYNEAVERAERAESELAALKARMRPVARVENGEVRALMDPADEGKYVAVVVVEE